MLDKYPMMYREPFKAAVARVVANPIGAATHKLAVESIPEAELSWAIDMGAAWLCYRTFPDVTDGEEDPDSGLIAFTSIAPIL